VCSKLLDGAAGIDLSMQRVRGQFQEPDLQQHCEKKVNLGSNNDAFFSSDVPFKPAHPLVDRRKKDGSKIGKLGFGFANFVHIGRFSKMLNVGRGSVKQFENNVDNLGLAGPWLDKGWLDSIYASVIVTVFECRIKDGLEMS